jgi:hypothetical protein
MTAKRLLVVLAVVGIAFGVATAVQASIPGSNGVAHACYYIPGKPVNKLLRPGNLRLIDTDNGQTCGSDEAAVDLATTNYVTSNVNQTSFMFSFTQAIGAGNYYAWFTCGGWVATDPSVSVKPVSYDNLAITPHSMMNVGEVNNGVPGTEVREYFSISAAKTIVGHATCVDPRVYGLTYPVPAANRLTPPRPSLHLARLTASHAAAGVKAR